MNFSNSLFFLIAKDAHPTFRQEIDESLMNILEISKRQFSFDLFTTDLYVVREFENHSFTLFALLEDLKKDFPFCVRITQNRETF